MELYRIKVFPEIGLPYFVEIPESISDVDGWVHDNLKLVDFWEEAVYE